MRWSLVATRRWAQMKAWYMATKAERKVVLRAAERVPHSVDEMGLAWRAGKRGSLA